VYKALLILLLFLLFDPNEEFEELTEAVETLLPNIGENVELLIGLFLWTLPAQFLIGLLPQEAPLLYVSQYFNPVIITGTVMGALLIAEVANYQTVKAVGKIPQVVRVIQYPAVQRPMHWFRKAPFTTTIVAALTPIPFFPIRLLAPLSNYPMQLYIAAVAIGRIPRIFVLAWLGLTLNIPVWFLILLTIIPVILVIWKIFLGEKENPIYDAQRALLKKLPALGTIPNMMSISRVVIFLPLVVYSINVDNITAALLGIIFIGITDLFDGVIARKLNQITELGKFIDYAADIFCWLVIGFSLAHATDLPIGFVYFILTREVLHISLAAYLSGKGIMTRSSRVATISGSLTIITYCMYLLELPYRDIFLVLTILSLIIGTVYYIGVYGKEFITGN
jgi:phosphatidylglycerophosphate synthase/membrane protein YqaA with SNARE-associated domain